MQLIPKAVVVGLFSPVGIPGAQVSADKLNRLWADVAPTYRYTQLQMSPDGTAANFIGTSPEDGVTIQPPLLQVRDLVSLTPDQSARKAEAILHAAARHLGLVQFLNLGIKYIYHAPISDGDAGRFVLHRVLGKDEADVSELRLSDQFWAGVKYVVSHSEGVYTLAIEPLFADPRNIFIDLDAQYPGAAILDSIVARARDVEQYVTQTVNRYLDRVAEP